MLQVNELMIGDWVLHNREPYQIRQLGIFGVDRDGEDYPAVCVGKPKGVGLIVERNEIEPIHLTPEILEKNGFYREGCASYWHEGDHDASILHWSKDKNQLIVGSPCDDYMVKMNVRYIHELQHAFRLAGIEKEIVI